MTTIKVGLIGFGMAGRVFHAPLIKHVKGLDLVCIRETKKENLDIIKERYPEVDIVSTSQAILDDRNIEMVVIATPNKFHYQLAKEAILSGKHVVVDKPFTVTSQEAAELLDLAKERRTILSVYQNRRWDSDFLTVKKILESKKLGRLVEYEAHYDRFKPEIRPNSWKEEASLGTGMLYDLGSHLIDQALVLFGLPHYITADIRSQRDDSVIPDYFSLMLEYETFKVSLKAGMLVKEPLPKYIISGTEGSFVKYGLDVQEKDLNDAVLSIDDPKWGEEPEQIWGMLNTQKEGRKVIKSEKGSYPDYYRNVYSAITGDHELLVDAKQALQTIRVIELAMKSNQEKRSIPIES